jgi:hypothetical protein
MEHWSDYEKYICMINGEGNTPVGIRLGYEAFLDFKRVKEALKNMSHMSNDSYSLSDNIYKRSITQSRATQVLEKIEKCQWDEEIRKVARQIKAGDMLSAVNNFTAAASKTNKGW